MEIGPKKKGIHRGQNMTKTWRWVQVELTASDSGSRGPDPDTTSWVDGRWGKKAPFEDDFHVPDSVFNP